MAKQSKKPAYYNEHNEFAARWLRNLIAAGEIPAGIVDERSIEDVFPSDLRGFAQCHFFAGLGGWALALRLAGWSDNRSVWTGSCPCQPFSAAGKGTGFVDERHLWPAWHHLIKECTPATIFGEQVAAAVGKEWLSLVHQDLDGIGYDLGAAVVPACSVGALHRRDRLWIAAHPKRHKQRREEPRRREDGRMGRIEQPVSWHTDWEDALAGLRTLDDGLPRNVAATDAARNAIVPQVAAEVIAAYMEATA